MKRFISKIKGHGPAVIWQFVKVRILHINIMKLHYLKTRINYDFIQEQLRDFNLKVKELNYDDFLQGDKTVFVEKKMELIKKRCNDPTYKAFGIIENNTLLYSTWISFKKLGLPIKSNYLLASSEGLLEDSYCHPLARGYGIHSKMNFYRLAKLYELGKTECLAIVLDQNIPAYKVQMKSGLIDLGCFYAGEIFGIPFATLNKKKYDCK